MITDTWSSKHGRGSYICFVAHWVHFLAAEKDAGLGTLLELVVPPLIMQLGAGN